MAQLKIILSVALAAILQSSLRQIWPALVYIDLPLIVTVYFALQRDAVRAVLVGCFTGVATDALSRGLLGAGGFTKTLVAYLIATLTTYISLDNPLARIPVLAGAVVLDSVVYYFLHQLLGQPSFEPFVETMAFKLILTTVVGTAALYGLDSIFSERARQRRQLAFRRRIARRTLSRRR